MPTLDLKKLQTHRTQTFNLPPAKRVSSPTQALTFVNKRGFIYFWPIKGIDMPICGQPSLANDQLPINTMIPVTSPGVGKMARSKRRFGTTPKFCAKKRR